MNIQTSSKFKEVITVKVTELQKLQKEIQDISRRIGELAESYLMGKDVDEKEFQYYLLDSDFNFKYQGTTNPNEEEEFDINEEELDI